MRLLVDTNILLDHLLERRPYSSVARMLLIMGKLGEFDLFMSSSQLTDTAYILSDGGKKSRSAEAKQVLRELREYVRLAPLGGGEIDAALESDWDDFEDACVYQAAKAIGADAIITRNKGDYEKSLIKVLDGDDFFAWMQEEYGVCYADVEF